VIPLVQTAESVASEAHHEIAFLSHAGVGTVVFHLKTDSASNEETLTLLERLRVAVGSHGGQLFVERCEPFPEGKLGPWPSPGDGLPLMENLKRSLDPKNLWNPGRFAVK
jgi:FAD/FMN-containing dehydrogenase